MTSCLQSTVPEEDSKISPLKNILKCNTEENIIYKIKKFKCELCECRYSHKFALSQHIRRCHKKDTPYKCNLCSYAAVINSELTRHMRKHGIFDRTFPCRYCDEIFKFPEHRRNHETIHTGKVFICSICKREFRLRSVYKLHLRTHTKTKCKFCERSFHEIEVLRKHEIAHSEIKSRPKSNMNGGIEFCMEFNFIKTCILCNSDVRSLGELKTHVLREHSELFDVSSNDRNKVPKWNAAGQCPVCAKVVKTKHDQFTHLLGHIGIVPYKCHLCEYKSSWITNLKIHFLKHVNGPQQWRCEPCNKTFNKKCHYTAHTNKRHGEFGNSKVYLCEKCGKGFSRIQSFNKHKLRAHKSFDEDTVYHCTSCNVKFEHEINFELHMNLHKEGEKYRCAMCGKMFSHKESLNKHCNTHPEMLECHICNTAFDSFTLIEKHRKLCDMQRVCFLCDEGTLIEHGDFISLHLKESHLSECMECDLCRRLFASPWALHRHLVSHCLQTNDSNYEVYDPTFDSEDEEMFGIGDERREKSTVESPLDAYPPFLCECSVCGASFYSCKDLVKHEAKHTILNVTPKLCPVKDVKKERIRKAWEKVKKIKIIVLDTKSYAVDSTVTPNEYEYSNPYFQSFITLPSTTSQDVQSIFKQTSVLQHTKTTTIFNTKIVPSNSQSIKRSEKIGTILSCPLVVRPVLHFGALNKNMRSSVPLIHPNSSAVVNPKFCNKVINRSVLPAVANNFMKTFVPVSISNEINVMKETSNTLNQVTDILNCSFSSNEPSSELKSNTHKVANNSDKEYVIDIKMGERKIREKVVYKDGRKWVVTEDCGFYSSAKKDALT